MSKLNCLLLAAAAPAAFSAEITPIGELAYHVVLAGSDREASIPNPDGLAVYIVSAKGNVCWDLELRPAIGCVGPGGSSIVPSRTQPAGAETFIDPGRPAGALVHKTADGRTRLAVNDRDTDVAFRENTGQFEFDVFLAPREATESAGLEWIRDKLVRIDSAEPRSGAADLRALRNAIGGARLVTVGEATHGTREFSQLKHRVLEFLAGEMGFGIFAIEGNLPEAARLNDYVLNGTGDPAGLLRQNVFSVWNTEEVLDMVRWMREFNASGRGRLRFMGFDMQAPGLPAQIVRQFASTAEPGLLADLDRFHGDALRRFNNLIASFNPSNQPGVASAEFPLSAVRAGQRVRFSGYIKTQDVHRGHAGLLWRVASGNQATFNDNMAARGATGTTGWKQYSIELTMPRGATGITFGVTHTGDGVAWFDDLAIEVDGVPFASEGFDFDFESPGLRGFRPSGLGYAFTIDRETAQRGSQSLRSRLMTELPYAEATAGCASIVERLETNREAYLARGMTPESIEWAIRNARLVQQFVLFLPSPQPLREKFMAENIEWIAAQNPGDRIMVWAHNLHVATVGSPYTNNDTGLASAPPMGAYLREKFGSEMVVFGFAFNQGRFGAFDLGGRGWRDFTVPPGPEGSMDRLLAQTGVPLFALDMREATRTGPGALLRQTLFTRSVGSVYDERIPEAFLSAVDSAAAHDVMLFVETTAAARLLR